MFKYKFSTNDWYRPLSFLNNKIDTYVNFDIVYTATAITTEDPSFNCAPTQFHHPVS